MQVHDFGVSAAGRHEALAEIHVVVVDHRLVAGDRLVAIAVREGEDRVARRLGRLGARVIEHRHVLHRAGPRAVEREVAAEVLALLVFRLADAERKGLACPGRSRGACPERSRGACPERSRGVLAVPAVAQVLVALARPEEVVRRRERGDGAGPPAFDNQQAIRGLERRLAFVPRAAEQVFLPHVRQVAPRQAAIRRREAFQAGVVLVGDGVLAGLRDDFLLNQIAALVDRELQLPGEDAQAHARERHGQVRPVRLHVAAVGLVGCGRAMDLVRLARQSDRPPVVRHSARDVERRVPERVPLVRLEDVGRDLLDAVLLEPFLGLAVHAPAAGHDPELRRHVAG